MKVLYIGGTGEISAACVRRSVEVGHDVTVFNRGTRDEPLGGSVRQISGDIKDDEAYFSLARERYDAVCQFLAFDLDAVRRDLEVFEDHCGQYVFISSASAYQKPPEQVVLTEDVPLENPYWAYSQAKADMERWLMEQDTAGRLPVTIVRPSHTHRTRFPGGIAGGDEWAWRMLHGRAVIVHGDGTSLWTLTHSSDFADVFVRLLGNSRALGEAFHITRHMESFTWNRIYSEMAAALDCDCELVHVPSETLVRYNPKWTGPLLGDKTWSVMFDNSKVMSAAGEFACRVSLEEAMAGAAEDYLRRRAGQHEPAPEIHDLLDRIVTEQRALGG